MLGDVMTAKKSFHVYYEGDA
ncbi:MAG: hypothetical protein RL011_2080, partial [Pseudomonadota bacterium]